MWRNGAPTVIAVLVMVMGFAHLHLSGQEERERQREELEAVRSELRQLQQTLRQPVRQESSLPPAPQVARESAPVPSPALVQAQVAAPPAATAVPAAPTSPQELQSRMEEAVYTESVDPSWSRQAEDQARAGLQQLLGDSSRLESVRCSASLCRIETSHRSRDDLQRFSEQTVLSPQPALWNGAMFASLSPDSREGHLISVIYLAREGRPLPAVGHP